MNLLTIIAELCAGLTIGALIALTLIGVCLL